MKFRFVDKIMSISRGDSISTSKAISFEEYCLLRPWGRMGVFPETLILQFAIESASLLLAFRSGFTKIGLLYEVINAKYYSQTQPGDVLAGKIDMRIHKDSKCAIDFLIATRGSTIAEGSIMLAETPLAECYDRETFLLIWDELNGNTTGT